ncbi:unnamed protein product [marine sediment metagenome]|uniref:GIY-YIG domain-containing protein n=1 Tax=marine sediment metagenome TaxID=412755 RepID=X1DS04_9ZZZZ
MKKLNKLKKYYFAPICGIYFLFDYNNKLIYIGKSINIHNRIRRHEIKSINYYSIIEFQECDLEKMEKYYIDKYNPKYNKHHKNKFRDLGILNKYIQESGLRKNWIAEQLDIPQSTLSHYQNGTRTMPALINNRIIKLISR